VTDFAKAVIRDFVKKVLGIVFAWLAVNIIAIPQADKDAVTNWVVLTVTAGFMFVWAVVVHWLETRTGNNPFAVACRALARLLMLGISFRPTYPGKPVPVPVVTPIHQVGPDGKPL
jgi:hypothetical protein